MKMAYKCKLVALGLSQKIIIIKHLHERESTTSLAFVQSDNDNSERHKAKC